MTNVAQAVGHDRDERTNEYVSLLTGFIRRFDCSTELAIYGLVDFRMLLW